MLVPLGIRGLHAGVIVRIHRERRWRFVVTPKRRLARTASLAWTCYVAAGVNQIAASRDFLWGRRSASTVHCRRAPPPCQALLPRRRHGHEVTRTVVALSGSARQAGSGAASAVVSRVALHPALPRKGRLAPPGLNLGPIPA
eukprot:46186-Rhodomonas_salina.1